MEKIKVGEYVRNRLGIIRKIISIDKHIFYLDKIYYEKNLTENIYEDFDFMFDTEILKHSPNIFDLIEEGDYINGHKILEIRQNAENGLRYLMYDYVPMKYYVERTDTIKSIVTKQQYENSEYKVGE